MGATVDLGVANSLINVSTHAPVMGATLPARQPPPYARCFNPRARDGRDKPIGESLGVLDRFQPTRP